MVDRIMFHVTFHNDCLDQSVCQQAVPGRTLGLGAPPGPVGGSEEILLEVKDLNFNVFFLIVIIIIFRLAPI